MKFFKKVAILLIMSAALFLVLALFVKKDFSVYRSIDIEVEIDIAYEYLVDITTISEIYPVNLNESTVKKTFSKGQVQNQLHYSWSSTDADVGSGEMQLTEQNMYTHLHYQVNTVDPESEFLIVFEFEDVEGALDRITLNMSVEGEIPYPLNLLSIFKDYDDEWAAKLEHVLNVIKSDLEAED